MPLSSKYDFINIYSNIYVKYILNYGENFNTINVPKQFLTSDIGLEGRSMMLNYMYNVLLIRLHVNFVRQMKSNQLKYYISRIFLFLITLVSKVLYRIKSRKNYCSCLCWQICRIQDTILT